MFYKEHNLLFFSQSNALSFGIHDCKVCRFAHIFWNVCISVFLCLVWQNSLTVDTLQFPQCLLNPVNKLHDFELYKLLSRMSISANWPIMSGMSRPPLPYWTTCLEYDWSVQRRQERCDIAIFVAYVLSLQRCSGLSVGAWLPVEPPSLSLKRSASWDIKAVSLPFNFWRARRTACLNVAKVSKYCFFASWRVWVSLLI